MCDLKFTPPPHFLQINKKKGKKEFIGIKIRHFTIGSTLDLIYKDGRHFTLFSNSTYVYFNPPYKQNVYTFISLKKKYLCHVRHTYKTLLIRDS